MHSAGTRGAGPSSVMSSTRTNRGPDAELRAHPLRWPVVAQHAHPRPAGFEAWKYVVAKPKPKSHRPEKEGPSGEEKCGNCRYHRAPRADPSYRRPAEMPHRRRHRMVVSVDGGDPPTTLRGARRRMARSPHSSRSGSRCSRNRQLARRGS